MRGVLLPQRTRRGVAGVGERWFPRLDEPGVDGGETVEVEEHLPAHLEELRHALARELVRDVADGADVVGDVLARPAVAARDAAHEAAALVHQVDRQAVDLRFAQVPGALADLLLDACGPLRQLVEGEGVVEAEHALGVVDGGELGGERAADGLGGRVRRAQLRVLLLERAQFPLQLVVLPVAQRGGVAHVVREPRGLDPGHELLPAVPGRRGDRTVVAHGEHPAARLRQARLTSWGRSAGAGPRTPGRRATAGRTARPRRGTGAARRSR